jgi:nucleotide-binding universal stress UspA family protein
MIRKKIKKILVPMDGSKNSFRGLDGGIYLARQCQAIITGLYVVPIFPRNLLDTIIPFQTPLTKEAEKLMNYAKIKCAQKGIVFKSKIVFGSPAMEINNLSQTGKFDIIVIGSRGQSGIKEAFLGSTSNYVLHKSKIPVLVVK